MLRAPTGAGKTWGVVAPFLYGIVRGETIADRLPYALPLRSLATSLHQEVSLRMEEFGGSFADLRREGKDRDYLSSRICCSLQMGGSSADPYFESDLVFSTIDQLLSSYLMHPVSLPGRLANIPGGALIGWCGSRYSLEYRSLDGAKGRKIVADAGSTASPGLGLAVTPDQKTLFFTSLSREESDLYLIKAWH